MEENARLEAMLQTKANDKQVMNFNQLNHIGVQVAHQINSFSHHSDYDPFDVQVNHQNLLSQKHSELSKSNYDLEQPHTQTIREKWHTEHEHIEPYYVRNTQTQNHQTNHTKTLDVQVDHQNSLSY